MNCKQLEPKGNFLQAVGFWTVTIGGILIVYLAVIGAFALGSNPIGQGACLELCQGKTKEVSQSSCTCSDGEIKKRWVPSAK